MRFFWVVLLVWGQEVSPPAYPNPKVALALSAAFPGTGQLYNKAYWKAPLVWGALAFTGYLAYQNHRQYLYYRQAYREALAGYNPLPTLLPENIRALREAYRKDRDVFLLVFCIAYGLQIGEAYADAYLKKYSVYAGVTPAGIWIAARW
ncbi:MAG: DUF5683 domain-containing protein [Bacteroidia bacterium]|jgi:hypothetical protein|nr:DUF5683 domain-containing protein [Bacteroidia bacterium]GIV23381.1 MAG: hypothetical protein KatS3mg025_1040 [Bacteroidia bacterium]